MGNGLRFTSRLSVNEHVLVSRTRERCEGRFHARSIEIGTREVDYLDQGKVDLLQFDK